MLHKLFILLIHLIILIESVPPSCNFGYVSNGVSCEECGLSNFEPNIKIVGGVDAVPYSWPSHVQIIINYKVNYTFSNGKSELITQSFKCGGTLINHYTILTGGHCFLKTFAYRYLSNYIYIPIQPNEFYPTWESMFKIVLGGFNVSNLPDNPVPPTKIMNISRIIQHPNYDSVNVLNDIMLLILSKSVEYNTYIQPACLPINLNSNYPPTNSSGFAVGWGLLDEYSVTSDTLQNVKLNIYDSNVCSNYRIFKNQFNWNSQICSGTIDGTKDTCTGDSGGALYTIEKNALKSKKVVAGITSYGYGCAKQGFPGIYTRTSFFLNWITTNWVYDNTTFYATQASTNSITSTTTTRTSTTTRTTSTTRTSTTTRTTSTTRTSITTTTTRTTSTITRTTTSTRTSTTTRTTISISTTRTSTTMTATKTLSTISTLIRSQNNTLTQETQLASIKVLIDLIQNCLNALKGLIQ